MTRINLVCPSELTDQHLMAEYREIKMVPRSLARSLRARGLQGVLQHIPKEFTLNTGHVSFFYDKMWYLDRRHTFLFYELLARGVDVDVSAYLENCAIFVEYMGTPFWNLYVPTKEALRIIRERIAEKVAMKPAWYRYCGVSLADPECEYAFNRRKDKGT